MPLEAILRIGGGFGRSVFNDDKKQIRGGRGGI
jgi:hypothetical protein